MSSSVRSVKSPSSKARSDVWAVRLATLEEEAEGMRGRVRSLGGYNYGYTDLHAALSTITDKEASSNDQSAPKCTDVLLLEGLVSEVAALESHSRELVDAYYAATQHTTCTNLTRSEKGPHVYRPVPPVLKCGHPEALAEMLSETRALLAHALSVNARLSFIAVTAAKAIYEKLEMEISKGYGFVTAAGAVPPTVTSLVAGDAAKTCADSILSNSTDNNSNDRPNIPCFGGKAFLQEVARYTPGERITLIKACRDSILGLIKSAKAMENAWAHEGGDCSDAEGQQHRFCDKENVEKEELRQPSTTEGKPREENATSFSASLSASRAEAVRALIPSAFSGPLYSYDSHVAPLLEHMEKAEALLWAGKNAAARRDVAEIKEAAEAEIAYLDTLQRYGKEEPILNSPVLIIDEEDGGKMKFVPRPTPNHTDLGSLKAKLEALEKDEAETKKEAEEPFIVLPAVERRRLLVEQQVELQKGFRRHEGKQFEHEGLAVASDAYVIGDEAFLPEVNAKLFEISAGNDGVEKTHMRRGLSSIVGEEKNSLRIMDEASPTCDNIPTAEDGDVQLAQLGTKKEEEEEKAGAGEQAYRGGHTLDSASRRFIAKFGPTLFARTKVEATLGKAAPFLDDGQKSSYKNGDIATSKQPRLLQQQEQQEVAKPSEADSDTDVTIVVDDTATDENDTGPNAKANIDESAFLLPSSSSAPTMAKPSSSRAAVFLFDKYDRRDSLMARSAAENTLQTRNALEHFRGPISEQNKKISNLRALGMFTTVVPGGEYVLGHLNPKESATLLPIAESIDKSSRLDRRTNYWLSSTAPSVVAGTLYTGGEQHFMFTTAPRHVAIDDWAVTTRPITVRQFMTAVRDTRIRAEMERILLVLNPDAISEEERIVYSPVMAPPPYQSPSGFGGNQRNAAAGGYLDGFISYVEKRQRDARLVRARPRSALAKVESALKKTSNRNYGNTNNNNNKVAEDEDEKRTAMAALYATGDSYVTNGARSPRSQFLETVKNDPSDIGYTDDTLEVPYFIAEAFARALGGVVCPPDVWEAMTTGAGGDKQRFIVPNVANVPQTLGLHQLQWSVDVDGGHRPVKGSSWRITEAEGLRFLRSQEGQFGHELLGRCGHEWNQTLDVTFEPRSSPPLPPSFGEKSRATQNQKRQKKSEVEEPPIDLREHFEKKRMAAIPPPTPQEIIAGKRADGSELVIIGGDSAPSLSLSSYTRRYEDDVVDDLATRFSREAQAKIIASGLRPPTFASWRPPHCNCYNNSTNGPAGGGSSHILRSTTDHLTQTMFSGTVTGVVTFHGDDHREVILPPPHSKCYDNEHAFVGPNFHTFSLPHHGLPVAAFRIAIPACGKGQRRVEEALHSYDRRLGRHITFADIIRSLGRGRGTIAGERLLPLSHDDDNDGTAGDDQHDTNEREYENNHLVSPSSSSCARITRGRTAVLTAGGSVRRAGRIGAVSPTSMSAIYKGMANGDTMPDINEGEAGVAKVMVTEALLRSGEGGSDSSLVPLEGEGWLAGVEPDLIVPPGPAEDAQYADTERWVLSGAGVDLCFSKGYPYALRKIVLFGPYKGTNGDGGGGGRSGKGGKLSVIERWLCSPSIRGTAACHVRDFEKSRSVTCGPSFDLVTKALNTLPSYANTRYATITGTAGVGGGGGGGGLGGQLGLDNTGLHGNNLTSYAAFLNKQQLQHEDVNNQSQKGAAVNHLSSATNGGKLVGDQRFDVYVAGGGVLPLTDASEGILIRTDSLDGFCYSLPLYGKALIEADDAIRQANTDARLYREYAAEQEHKKSDYKTFMKAARNNANDATTRTTQEENDPILSELCERRRGRRGSTISSVAVATTTMPPRRGGGARDHNTPLTQPRPNDRNISAIDGEAKVPCCLLRIIEDSSYRLVYTDRVTMRPPNDPRGLLPDIVSFVEITWTKSCDPSGGGHIVTEISIAPTKDQK